MLKIDGPPYAPVTLDMKANGNVRETDYSNVLGSSMN